MLSFRHAFLMILVGQNKLMKEELLLIIYPPFSPIVLLHKKTYVPGLAIKEVQAWSSPWRCKETVMNF